MDYKGGMRIGREDGPHIILDPRRYEYPELTSPGTDDWDDANWLVVGGEVHAADGRAWRFSDPCLQTTEAQHLSRWLRSTSAGDVDAVPSFDADSEHVAAFTEPHVAFSLASRRGDRLVVRAHLSLESGPPWRTDEEDEYYEPFVVDIETTTGELMEAADTWDCELAPFSVRGAQ